jgi:uncharacterized membrane protein YidH (DUF202 family)
MNDENSSSKRSLPRDHLANERTFLAWIRTSLGVMAFGFVVERFALFIKQISFFLIQQHAPMLPPGVLQGYSSLLGIFLVALGTLICLLAFIKYKIVERQIEEQRYRPSWLLNVTVTLVVIFTGIFLIVYLNQGLL